MAEEECVCEECESGAPAWMATFADLMSLLMCFFVLLLSFSEMDAEKYKQVAGSMKFAFGVQKLIKAEDVPKGTSIIAQEFSPGIPQPTIFQVINQVTVNDALKLVKQSEGEKESNPDSTDSAQSSEMSEKLSEALQKALAETMSEEALQALSKEELQALKEARLEVIKESNEGLLSESELEALKIAEYEEKQRALTQEAIENALGAVSESIRELATMMMHALQDEIEAGSLDLVIEANAVRIRIRESDSFPSGSADLQPQFHPILEKLGRVLKRSNSQVIVAGHTDNIPIKTANFPSNWVLSASRAASVVHYLAQLNTIEEDKMEIRAYADTQPIVDNSTKENRAQNRRVEIIVSYKDIPDNLKELKQFLADEEKAQELETTADDSFQDQVIEFGPEQL